MSSTSIRLVHASAVPRRSPCYPYVPIEYTLALLGCTLIPTGSILFVATHVTWVSPLGWVLLPLMALVLVSVCGAIGLGAYEHVRASFGAENWLARHDARGLYLHVRSFLNWRYPPHVRTVAFVPFSAISSVHSLHETFVLPFRQHRTVHYYSFTVLTLLPDVDTSELDAAVREELLRVPRKTGFIEAFQAWDDVPVFVGRPGQIWIVYRTGRLRRALSRVITPAQTERRRVAGEAIVAMGDASAVRRLALDVLYRGRRVDAARTLGMAFGLGADASDDVLIDVLRTGG